MRTTWRRARSLVFAIASATILGPSSAEAGDDAPRPSLAGTWTLNKSLSTPAGSVPMPDHGPDTDQVGRGVSGRRGAFGPGGPRGRGPRDFRDREADMARRGLMEELMALPASITIAQDGDRVAFADPDGVVRVYYANNRTEKHQLINGTIETKSKWDDGSLLMELKARGGMTITRRYALRPGAPAQLEITTRTDRDRKGVKRVAIYQSAETDGAAANE